MTVTVKGAKELRATMKQAGADMGEMKAAHARVAGIVAGAARPPRVSGRLAGSVRGAGQLRKAVVRAGGARVPYAGVIEYGWPARGIASDPFLRDAAHQTEPSWFDVYLSEVQAIVDRVHGA